MNFGFGADNAKSTTRPFPVKEAVDNVELDKAEYIKATSANGNDYEGIKFHFKRTASGQIGLQKEFFQMVLRLLKKKILITK